MDIVNASNQYRSIRVRWDDEICFIQIHRPEANNAISNRLIDEFTAALGICETEAKTVVVEGSAEFFCFGADFKEIERHQASGAYRQSQNAEGLYDLWTQLASGPFISVAHVRGKANAGGIGFVAACDVTLCDANAIFSLSELLFGLMPACVFPFLTRRTGFSKANYMTLMTQPISAKQAFEWGLIDAYDENSENLLRKQLLRLTKLSKTAITRYKRYRNSLSDVLLASKPNALAANEDVFSDPANLAGIARYVRTGAFPWEAEP